jgi:2-aminoadipate transaminase
MSKILSPGLRVGYYVAPKTISDQLTSMRQSKDVHTTLLAQAIAAKYLAGGYQLAHIDKIRKIYSKRLNALLTGLGKYMPSGFSWTQPSGGMYVWVTGPKGFDAEAFNKRLITNHVAVVPGNNFFINTSSGKNTFRINFSNTSEENIKKAIKHFPQLIK